MAPEVACIVNGAPSGNPLRSPGVRLASMVVGARCRRGAGVVTELWIRGNDDLHALGDAVLQAFEDIRSPSSPTSRRRSRSPSFGAVQVLRVVLAIALIFTKRFRHLVVALATFVISDWLVLTFLDAAPAGDVAVDRPDSTSGSRRGP